jgi:hypothetical protein
LINPTQLQEPDWLLPFQWMEIGDSFFIPTLRPAQTIHSISSGARRAGIRVKCYVTVKNEHLGVRAWRVT